MITDRTDTSPRGSPLVRQLRRAGLVPLLLALAMAAAIGASTGVASGHADLPAATQGTDVSGSSVAEPPSLSTPEVPDSSAQDERTFAPPVVLQTLRDHDGTTWRAITRESNDGRCIEVEAVSTNSGRRLGMLGGCGLPEVDYDGATGFRRARNEPLLIPIAGDLNVQSATGTVLFGLASCNCNVRATFSDGAVSNARAKRGFYLIHRDGVGAVPMRLEALDDAGQVLTSYDLPSRVETPLPVVGDLLGRVG